VIAARLALAVALCLSCATRLDRDETWVEVETEHVRLYSSSWPELAVAMSERLELFHMLGRELLGEQTLEERMPTYVYVLDAVLWYGTLRSAQNLRGVLVPHPHANYLTVQALSQREEALRLAQNLYVRVLQQTRENRTYPRWYETGIGELLSTVEVRDDYVLIGRVSRYRRGLLERGFREREQRGVQRGGARRGTWVPLRTVMSATGEKSWPRDRRYMFYAESWALTYYLSWKEPERLARYLELVLSGQTHDQAFETVFGSHYALEQQLDRFFQGRERLWRIPHEHFQVEAEPRVRALAPPRWNALLGELLISRRLPDQAALAQQRYEHALDGEPDLVQAHAGLGTALVIQGKEGGDAHIERALELAPDDARTRLYAGEYFLERARSARPVERAQIERARRELERALELASDLGAAYYALGQTYLLPGEDPQQALAPLEHAHALMSWQRDVTLALGEAHLRTGQTERARQLLERVVRGTHNEQTRKRAEELLAELASGRPADAQ
jgi:tetratricopeptide (TPR) repeat protein